MKDIEKLVNIFWLTEDGVSDIGQVAECKKYKS